MASKILSVLLLSLAMSTQAKLNFGHKHSKKSHKEIKAQEPVQAEEPIVELAEESIWLDESVQSVVASAELQEQIDLFRVSFPAEAHELLDTKAEKESNHFFEWLKANNWLFFIMLFLVGCITCYMG